MEAVLNFVWLLLATIMVITLVMSRGTRFQKREWLVILCLVVLLFPVISMSDDMAAMIAASEGGQPGKDSLLSQDHLIALEADSWLFQLHRTLPVLPFRFLAGRRRELFRSPALLACQCWPRVDKRPPPALTLPC